MIYPDFLDKKYSVAFNIIINSHHINHTNSKIIITPKHKFEAIVINNIVKQISILYGRLRNQKKYKYETVLSATFDNGMKMIK